MRPLPALLAGALLVPAALGGATATAADAADPVAVLRAEQAVARDVGSDGYLVRFDDPSLLERLQDLFTTGAIRDGEERASAAVADVGGVPIRIVRDHGPGGLLLADLDEAEALALLAAGEVSAVVPNLRVETTARRVALVQDTPLSGPIDFWNLDRIDRRDGPYDDEYRYTSTGAGVDVYVLDTGIWWGHADFTRPDGSAVVLPPSTFTGGYFTFGTDTAFPGDDCDGHGSHVAGTVAGRYSGVAKDAALIPVRIFPLCFGTGSVAAIIGGLDWVVENRRDGVPAVVNMSLGARLGPTPDAADVAEFELYDQELQVVMADGVIVVVAAGNRDEDACWHWPARVGAAITVGAVDADDVRSDYPDRPDGTPQASNYGTCVDVFAPGSAIWSSCGALDCTESTFSLKGGTSMASPLVAGLVARYLETNPTADQATVAAAVVGGAWSGLLTEFRLSSWGDLSSPNLLANTVWLEPALSTVGAPVVLPCTDAASSMLTQLVPGGVAPLSWSVTSGTLPTGLAMSSAGRLTGSAELSSVTGTVTVQVEDAFGRTVASTLQRGLLPPGCD